MLISTMLVIQGTGSHRGQEAIDGPIVDARWEHNDGFADERRADG